MTRVDWWLLLCILFALATILWVGLFREWRLEGENVMELGKEAMPTISAAKNRGEQ